MQPRNNSPLLIIAQSGRALAASALRAGIQSYVIDCFRDADTEALAAHCRVVRGDERGMDCNDLQQQIQQLNAGEFSGVVIGSGLEAAPGWIAGLPAGWRYYGNTAAVRELCSDPLAFSQLLQQLAIPGPAVSSQHPELAEKWLAKERGCAGGGHVRLFDEATACTDSTCFQRYLQGRHVSAVFLADGCHARLVGVSETDVVNRDAGDFRYAGACGIAMADPWQRQLQDSIDKLAAHLALRGLCGVDAVIDEQGNYWLLELNPRPTATFSLYEGDDSLLAAHISSCCGETLPVLSAVPGFRGQQVFYADADITVPALDWPQWITDRPPAGRLVRKGQPLCTLHAEAATTAMTRQQLQQRACWLMQTLGCRQQAA